MRLRLNLCDVDVQLKINDWKRIVPKEECANWCDVELTLQSKFLNYDTNGEILLAEEVWELENMLEMLLNGTLDKDYRMRFVEPDIEFSLRVAKRLYDVPGEVVYRNGYKNIDIGADFMVNFWCSGGLSTNTLIMGLDRKDITDIHNYLRVVTGEIKINDPIVIGMCKEGTLLPE